MKNKLCSLLALCGFTVVFNSCDKKDDGYKPPIDHSKAIVLSCLIENDMVLTDHNLYGVDYIVDCDVEVRQALLTITEGVTIQFKENTSLKVNKDAAIAVNGTAAKQVVMKGEHTGACWWGLLIQSKDSRNKINHLTISNTGYGELFHDVFAGYIYDAKIAIGVEGMASITNTTVDDCKGIGIIYGSEATITGFSNNKISNCTLYPLMISGEMLSNTLNLSSSTYLNNGSNYIALYSHNSTNVVNKEVTFQETPVPYFVFNSIEFRKNVTMEGGVELLMEEESYLLTTGSTTNFRINGTASKPVVIRGKMAGAGYWKGICLGGNSQGTFNYLNISGGGNDFVSFNVPFKANINVGDIDPASLTINNCSSSDNADNCDVGVHNHGALLINNSPAIVNICQE